ncbi:HET-domain-containing protein, partial [Hyaloscypha variabilis F]
LYLPLQGTYQEIRLLYIQPSSDPESVIECSLRTDSAEKRTARAYIALSYVWGTPTPSQTILVNNVSFSITPNLFFALRQICRMPGLGYLHCSFRWIDTLCIYQAGVLERSSQVRIMQDIYKNADIVVSWLGEEAQGS